MRVEGATQTIFEAPVTTDGHVVNPASGGAHPCDGTNGGANPSAGPTPTAALDDGAKLGNFTWAGTFFDGFGDYSVDRVAAEPATDTQFWGVFVDGIQPSVGGCQFLLEGGQEVLWAFDAFSKARALRLSGPSAATVGQPVAVKVTDTANGAPLADADVNGTKTGADGIASLSFAQTGVYRLKAERADAVRSNALVLCVDPAGAEPCTAGDKTPPTVAVKLPGGTVAGGAGLSTAQARSRTLTIAWQAQDPQADGSGLSTYTAEVREVASGARASQAPQWRTILSRSKDTSVVFRGRTGRAYEFRVTAFDRAANASTPATGTLVFPVDDRNRRMLRLSRATGAASSRPTPTAAGRSAPSARALKRVCASAARASRSSGASCPKGGRLQVTIDGKRAATLKLEGRGAARQTLYTSKALKAGNHVLRLEGARRRPRSSSTRWRRSREPRRGQAVLVAIAAAGRRALALGAARRRGRAEPAWAAVDVSSIVFRDGSARSTSAWPRGKASVRVEAASDVSRSRAGTPSPRSCAASPERCCCATTAPARARPRDGAGLFVRASAASATAARTAGSTRSATAPPAPARPTRRGRSGADGCAPARA